jgi:hypothetical protein
LAANTALLESGHNETTKAASSHFVPFGETSSSRPNPTFVNLFINGLYSPNRTFVIAACLDHSCGQTGLAA